MESVVEQYAVRIPVWSVPFVRPTRLPGVTMGDFRSARPELQKGGYPRDGTKFENKEEHLRWRGTWIARRGCGFVRKRHSGKNSWWVCERCRRGGFKCRRGRRPVVVDGVVQKGKMVYTSFTYEEVRPCDCGVDWGLPEVGDRYGKRTKFTAACRRMFGSGNYSMVETGSRLRFNCNHCDGCVEGRMSPTVSAKDTPGFGAPVTVVKSDKCSEDCRRLWLSLIDTAQDSCVICRSEITMEPPSATTVRLAGCCNKIVCRGCFEDLVNARPYHLRPNGAEETYVIKFDPLPGNDADHYYKCPSASANGPGSEKCQRWYATYEIECCVTNEEGDGAWEKTTLQEQFRIPVGFVYDVRTDVDRAEYDAVVLARQLQQYKAHLTRSRTMPVLQATEWHPSDGYSSQNPVNVDGD